MSKTETPELSSPFSALAPLRHPAFRRLWAASVVSNSGAWMHDVATAWLMTSMTSSPLMVSLIQAAESIPVFLLALPGGALADVVDRRRMLMFTQVWMAVAATTLGVLAIWGFVSPWILLGFALLMGIGNALNTPVWQSSLPEIVGREQLPAAITLNGIGFNLSRLIGPAIGGVLVAAVGSGPVFVINGASFMAVLAAVYLWRRSSVETTSPPERMAGAIVSGLRYVRHSAALHLVFWRSGVFVFFSSALWALLPLLARRDLGAHSAGYGLLIGCLGAGASGMALLLPSLRARFRTDSIVVWAELIFAGCLAMLGVVRSLPQGCVIMLVAGTVWITLQSTFNTAAQSVVPAWVRGRAISLYQVVFQGGTILGALTWGAAAQRAGVRSALLMTAAGLAIAAVVTVRFSLSAAEEDLDTTPRPVWDEPVVATNHDPERGHVVVLIEYRVPERDQAAFGARMAARSVAKRRDGASDWGLYRDTADPVRVVEMVTVESWAEHLRQHERTTSADMEEEREVRTLHADERPPVIRHLVALRLEDVRI
jgi:MFS family permease